MNKFSQGKWYTDNSGVVRCDDEYARSIAYLIRSSATKELDEANERLILAAPEMYRLLQNFAYPEEPYDTRKAELSNKVWELLRRIDDGKEAE